MTPHPSLAKIGDFTRQVQNDVHYGKRPSDKGLHLAFLDGSTLYFRAYDMADVEQGVGGLTVKDRGGQLSHFFAYSTLLHMHVENW